MIFYQYFCDILQKKITYNASSKSLIDILNEIAIKFKIKISMKINEDIIVQSINFYDKCLKNVLDDLEEMYDLHYKIENDILIIEQCGEKWKTYETNHFHEENSLNDFHNNMNQLDSQITTPKNTVKLFWTEVENTLKKLTNDNVVIDKYNCLIHVFGNCKIHDIVKAYIDKINTIKQVIIEVRFVEITSDFANSDINLLSLASNVLNSITDKLLKNADNLISTLNTALTKYKNVDIKISSTMKILLLSQNTGNIKITRDITLLKNNNNTSNKRYKSDTKTADTTKYEFSSGLCFTIVPLIIDSETVLLKLKHSLKTLDQYNQNIQSNQIDINNREITTIMYTEFNTPIIIGGLDEKIDKISKSLLGDIPILNILFPHTVIKKKSQTIVIITVKKSSS